MARGSVLRLIFTLWFYLLILQQTTCSHIRIEEDDEAFLKHLDRILKNFQRKNEDQILDSMDEDLDETFLEDDYDPPMQDPYTSTDDESLLNELSDIDMDKKRNLKKNIRLWTDNKIPFKFDSSLSTENQEKVRTMMKLIESSTCIQWVENNDTYDVLIQNGNGCSSDYGKVDGGQSISLKQDSCMSNKTVLHELCHTIGLGHEHSRSDRDKHLDIHWNNIKGGINNHNMEIKHTDNHGVPYDYFSVMQYPSNALAINKEEKTIESKDHNLNFLAGMQHKDLSFYDKLEINRRYECTGNCDQSCQHGGFETMDCKCYCPDWFNGDSCQNLIQEDNCPENTYIEIGSVDEAVVVTTDQFPNAYRHGRACRWLIKGPEESKLKVTIQVLDLPHIEGNDANTHCIHYLELRYNLLGQPGLRLCLLPNETQKTFEAADYSQAHIMAMLFNATAETLEKYRGFILTFEATPGNEATKSEDLCHGNDCQNGICKHNRIKYWCRCDDGFVGEKCDKNKENPQSNSAGIHKVLSDEEILEKLDLGSEWNLSNGTLTLNNNLQEKAEAELKIPFNLTEGQKYCLNFSIDRPYKAKPTLNVKLVIKYKLNLESMGVFLPPGSEHLFSYPIVKSLFYGNTTGTHSEEIDVKSNDTEIWFIVKNTGPDQNLILSNIILDEKCKDGSGENS